MMHKKYTDFVYIFDVDGTLIHSNIYTPIIVDLKIKKSYFLLLILYLIAPIIFLFDIISKSYHLYIVYSLLKKYLQKYNKKKKEILYSIFDKNLIKISLNLITKVKKNNSKLYFVSVNTNLINNYLQKFSPDGIYTINLDNLSLNELKFFKLKALSTIQQLHPNKKIIGIADSVSDLPFLNKCYKGYLLKKNILQRIK